MIGTDENRAVLYVEVIFWSGKRKTPPSLMSGKYCPHFVVIHQPWEMPNPYIQIPLTMPRWKTMRNF